MPEDVDDQRSPAESAVPTSSDFDEGPTQSRPRSSRGPQLYSYKCSVLTTLWSPAALIRPLHLPVSYLEL